MTQTIYSEVLRALKDFDRAKQRYEKAQETVTRLNNTPDWLDINQQFKKNAWAEYNEAEAAWVALGIEGA